MKCPECNSEMQETPCPDNKPGCEVFHTRCWPCTDPAEKLEARNERGAKINSLFKGKTIRDVEVGGVNAWMFHFTDGSKMEILSEIAINTPFGSIPGIFLNGEL